MSRKLLLLYETNDNAWDSIKEVQEPLIGLWQSWCTRHGHSFEVLDCGPQSLPGIAKKCLASDLVVIISHSSKIFPVIPLLRSQGLDKPSFAIYLYGLATVACWPLHLDGTLRFLTDRDTFIGTCEADRKCMQLSFSNARVEVIPFPIAPFEISTVPVQENKLRFAYIGRLSQQKNIHSVLEGLALLKQKRPAFPWSFEIYGKEDQVGLPNLGVPGSDYENSLKELSEKLGLKGQVNFHGWMPAQKIWTELDRTNTILVSMSLHSEENFGLSIFRGLGHGFRCVLSNWGGHRDFAKQFQNLVAPVTVYYSGNGPFVKAVEVAVALEGSLLSWHRLPQTSPNAPSLPDSFFASEAGEPLQATDLAQTIFNQRMSFAKSNSQQIFESFGDPALQLFAEAYGAKPVIGNP